MDIPILITCAHSALSKLFSYQGNIRPNRNYNHLKNVRKNLFNSLVNPPKCPLKYRKLLPKNDNCPRMNNRRSWPEDAVVAAKKQGCSATAASIVAISSVNSTDCPRNMAAESIS